MQKGITMSLYVNVDGQPIDVNQIVKWGRNNLLITGLPETVRSGPYKKFYGREYNQLTREEKECVSFYGHKLAVLELCIALQNATSYKTYYESAQKTNVQLQATANDHLNKCKTAEAELIAVKVLNLQLQAQVQPFEQVRLELAQVKQALIVSEEKVALKTLENEQCKRDREKIESDVDELKNRIATLEQDHKAKIKTLKKAHEASSVANFNDLKAMIAKLGTDYGSDTDTSHN